MRGLPGRWAVWPFRHTWEAPVLNERTSVGLDVHARQVVAHAIDRQTGEVFSARLCPDAGEIKVWQGME